MPYDPEKKMCRSCDVIFDEKMFYYASRGEEIDEELTTMLPIVNVEILKGGEGVPGMAE